MSVPPEEKPLAKDITAESLAELREAVESVVKSTNGMLKLEDAVEWQKED